MKNAIWAVVALPFLASPVHAQSLLSRLGQAVGNAVSNQVSKSGSTQGDVRPSTNDGLHNSNGIVANWAFPKFVPDTLDGYTHLRFGMAALDSFGNGVGGRPTCDNEYVGHDLFRQPLGPRDQQFCLGQEQMNDSSATMATVNQRMAALAGKRKFYTRGNVHLYGRVGPNMEQIPPGEYRVEWGRNSVPITPASPTSYRFVGPNWDLRNNGDTYHFLQPMALSDASKAGELSYVFFTVGDPYKDRQNPFIYDIPITVDKIVIVDDASTYTLTPVK